MAGSPTIDGPERCSGAHTEDEMRLEAESQHVPKHDRGGEVGFDRDRAAAICGSIGAVPFNTMAIFSRVTSSTNPRKSSR